MKRASGGTAGEGEPHELQRVCSHGIRRAGAPRDELRRGERALRVLVPSPVIKTAPGRLLARGRASPLTEAGLLTRARRARLTRTSKHAAATRALRRARTRLV